MTLRESDQSPPHPMREGFCPYCPHIASARGMDNVVAALRDHAWYCAAERAREALEAAQAPPWETV